MYKLSTNILVVENSKIWDEILKNIRPQLSLTNFKGWFSQTSLASINESTLTLVVPSVFVKNQLMLRFANILNETIQDVLGKTLTIDFIIDSTRFSKKASILEESGFELVSFAPSGKLHPLLNPKYSLENFVVGLTNNLAFAAAQAVVQNPGTTYNPLFVYGPSGVGKTHLMHGIGHSLVTKNPATKIIYVPSESFMNDFVESIQNKSTGRFRAKYRSCDLLLIDDIQFISGKDSTQEEFFHTFNEIYAKGAQVVLTSDRPPHEIQRLEPRLSSRFQGGLMVDIQLPDFDTRVAILKSKLAERGETLPEEILQLIAGTIDANTRELEGKLIQVLSSAKHTNQVPTVESVQKTLGASLSQNSQKFDYKKVLGRVNDYFNIKMGDLLGPRRQRQLVIPRQIAMFILHEDCKIPVARVGEILGGRDHTTVMHGVEKIKQAIARDREIQRLVMEVKQNLST